MIKRDKQADALAQQAAEARAKLAERADPREVAKILAAMNKPVAPVVFGPKKAAPSPELAAARAAERKQLREQQAWYVRRYLPQELVLDLKWSEAVVLAVLLRACRAEGGHQPLCKPSMPEIANRAGLSVRGAQKVMRALQALGKVEVIQRRKGPKENLTNVFRILCLLCQRRMKHVSEPNPHYQTEEKRTDAHDQAQQKSNSRLDQSHHKKGGEQKDGVNKGYIYPLSSTSRYIGNNQEKCRRSPRECERVSRRQENAQPGSAETSSSPNGPAPFQNSTPELLELSLRALKRLAPAMAAKVQAEPTFEKKAQRLRNYFERLKNEEIKGFDPDFWEIAVRRHGIRAYLATAETLLKSRTGFSFTHSQAAYLSGIVKHGISRGTYAENCKPEDSITKILEAGARV